MNNYNYKEVLHPLTGDVIWLIDDNSLALGGVSSLTKLYIEKYPHNNYSLSIYDTLTAKTIEIICKLDEMPQIVEYIYHLEKGTPLTFIGVNCLSESYVVGMSICNGKIEFGHYKTDGGKLIKC